MLRGATETQYRERLGLVALVRSGLLKHRLVAIDGGAHVGTWTELLAEHFAEVHAFEPGPAFEFLKENARCWRNATLHHEALADEICMVESWHRKGARAKLTARKVRKTAKGTVRAITVDSLALPQCSLIKLDLEGYEYPALIGARETIRRCGPFVLVELAGHGKHVGRTDGDVTALLEERGYEQVWKYHVDHGFRPKEVK